MADGDQIQGLPPGAIVKPIQGLPPGAIVKPIGGGNATQPAPRTTYHSNPSFANYAEPDSPARTVAQTPEEKEHQDTVLPYIHNPDAAPNASLFKYGAEAIPLGLGIGGAIEEGGLNAPTLLKFGRGLIGAGAGAYAGERAGSGVGGLFGETGRKIGGGIGALGGGIVGGGLAAGLEREPATMKQALAREPGRIKAMPFGIQRAMPEWMVPGPSEEALATAQERATQEQMGAFMNRGYTPQIGSGGPIIDIGEGTPETAAGTRSLVLTPSEAASEDVMQGIAKRRASERGMQFAGGMTPREGRKVPRLPARIGSTEYPGPRETIRFGDE